MVADQILVERAKGGEIDAFSELVLRHQKSLLRLAFRLLGDFELAQDVVQESLLKAHQKLHSFEGRSAFKSWVYQITLNTAKNRLRGKKLETVDIEKAVVTSGVDFEKEILSVDLKLLIQDEVSKLPLKQRTALSLRIYDDLSFSEIADIMNCPYDTAKANYRHALMKLRHTIADQSDIHCFLPNNFKERLEADA